MGSFFPSSSSTTICTFKPIESIELKLLKENILKYLKSHEGAYISDLSIELKVEPKKIIKAIRELKEDGMIV